MFLAWESTSFILGAVLVFQAKSVLGGTAVERRGEYVGRCIKCPVHLMPATLAHGSEAPTSHSPAHLAAEPGKQGQELPVFRELPQEQRFTRCLTRRRSVSAAPVCSWRAAGRRRPFVCLFSRAPRFSLALGIGCQGMQGIAPAQGQNIFLK